MSQQMTQHQFEIVKKLAPLSTLYGELKEGQAKIYAERLDAFSLDTVAIAIDRVIDTWKTRIYPPIGVLMDECRAQTGQSSRLHSGEQYPWVQRDQRIHRRVENFMQTLPNLQIAQEARRDGWDYDLAKYARACVRIQAQLIENDPCIGVPSVLVNWDEFNGLEVLLERRNALLDFCHRQAAMGMLAIEIPIEAITSWCAEASRPIRANVGQFKTVAAKLPAYGKEYFEAKKSPQSPAEQKEVAA